MLRYLCLIGLFLLTLTSCASFTPTNTIPEVKRSWAERQQLLNQVTQFQIAGKLAVKTIHDAGSATLNWNENKGQYTVSLFGPLGTYPIKIVGQPSMVRLESGKKKITAATPEQLLAQELGYQLPVSYLRYWIRGLPVANVPAQTQFDRYERLTELKQAGWQIRFLSYTNIKSLDLPNKISLNSADMQVKLIIYSWQIP